MNRVPQCVFEIWNFSNFKLEIRDLKAKSTQDSGVKVCTGGGMPKINIGIKRLLEILGQDYGIEESTL